KADNFDHVAVGARLAGSDLGRLVIVVRTADPYDEGRVVSALKARPHPEARKRRVLMFRRELLPTHADGLLSFPDDRTVVLGWLVRSPADMPTARREGEVRLPAEILDLLKGDHKPWEPVWAVAHDDGWEKPLGV